MLCGDASVVQPWVREETRLLPGTVERQRRSLAEGEQPPVLDSGPEYEDVLKIVRHTTEPESGLKVEEVCMMIRTKASFTINFETLPPSPVQVDSKVYDMPSQPDKVNGTCVLETETSKIFVFWSGFNFSIEFIKNPEGNSYYMNRVILLYDTRHPDLVQDFQYAANKGLIHLETRPGKNFFFTPLGKSYVCRKSDDQGPLKLYSIARHQIEGNLNLWQTKFQPFVKRAGGKWGEEKRCLPHEIREARMNFWPFVSAVLVILSAGLMFGGYAVKRTWFTEQKVDYGTYEAQQQQQQEMELVRQPSQDQAAYQAVSQAEPAQPAQPAAQPANPFQQKSANPFQAASNPFNQ